MPKVKKVKEEEVVVSPEEVTPEVAPEVKETKEVEFPEVEITGRFEAVKIGEYFYLYNPCGQRASGALDEVKAKDLARKNNRAAQIKIKPKK